MTTSDDNLKEWIADYKLRMNLPSSWKSEKLILKAFLKLSKNVSDKYKNTKTYTSIQTGVENNVKKLIKEVLYPGVK